MFSDKEEEPEVLFDNYTITSSLSLDLVSEFEQESEQRLNDILENMEERVYGEPARKVHEENFVLEDFCADWQSTFPHLRIRGECVYNVPTKHLYTYQEAQRGVSDTRKQSMHGGIVEEVLFSDGEVSETLCVDKRVKDKHVREKSRQASSLGFPPVTPRKAVLGNVIHRLVDKLWKGISEEILPVLDKVKMEGSSEGSSIAEEFEFEYAKKQKGKKKGKGKRKSDNSNNFSLPHPYPHQMGGYARNALGARKGSGGLHQVSSFPSSFEEYMHISTPYNAPLRPPSRGFAPRGAGGGVQKFLIRKKDKSKFKLPSTMKRGKRGGKSGLGGDKFGLDNSLRITSLKKNTMMVVGREKLTSVKPRKMKPMRGKRGKNVGMKKHSNSHAHAFKGQNHQQRIPHHQRIQSFHRLTKTGYVSMSNPIRPRSGGVSVKNKVNRSRSPGINYRRHANQPQHQHQHQHQQGGLPHIYNHQSSSSAFVYPISVHTTSNVMSIRSLNKKPVKFPNLMHTIGGGGGSSSSSNNNQHQHHGSSSSNNYSGQQRSYDKTAESYRVRTAFPPRYVFTAKRGKQAGRRKTPDRLYRPHVVNKIDFEVSAIKPNSNYRRKSSGYKT